ncbi:MAG: excinuclease ABC subunit UvrA [Pseudobdellovibrionaceae bacterium]
MKSIHLWGVKQNNLKNIEIKIPLGSMTVICGPSGSGKSSLAFETLFAEGQRRFIESMTNYARQFLNKAPKPDIEGIANIPPAIAIEQKNSVKNSRSTVGTTTELTDHLRLLYEKIGQAYCPVHHCPTERHSPTEAADKVIKNFTGQRGYILIEVPEKNRVAEGKKLLSLLLQEGYLRILHPPHVKSTNPIGDLQELNEASLLKKGLPPSLFYLVIDRLSFSKDEQGRLVDSLTQAYQASQKFLAQSSGRKAFVLTTNNEKIVLSEQPACPVCDYTPPPISSKLFSFNSPIGACPACKGFGNILDLDEKKIIPNPTLSIAKGVLIPFTMPSADDDKKQLLGFCKKHKIDVNMPWQDLPKNQRDMIWNGTKDFFGVKGLFEYLETKKYKMHVRVFIARFRGGFLCPDCKGSRLRQEALNVFIANKNIAELSSLTIEDLFQFFKNLVLSPTQQQLTTEIHKQIVSRLDFLLRVGVHYLTLSRETRTLSGGEYQRLNLANQLGMGLSQTLYVLDEPTVGLHPRDNDRLISVLNDLKNLGNTVVIVEHDQDVIKNSDYLIEMGPGSGFLGGEAIYMGPTKDFYNFKKSNTVEYLLAKPIQQRSIRPVDAAAYRFKIELQGAKGHNLKNLNVVFPLHRLVVITGVSGSGKSTLITKTLYPALARALDLEFEPAQEFFSIEGVENIKNVVLVDQSAIGKSARSSPVTYLKIFDAIRNLMAQVDEAKSSGYTPGTFSLNVDGGRCPACKGTGYEEIDMMFMDNVIIPCDVCDAKKYRQEILDVRYKGKNISDILNFTVLEAMDFFVNHPSIRKSLALLKEVGLDYLRLGQPANSLSGGESQRLKIAKELSQVQQKSTLYILDEPTTGLHFREIELLMKVLHKLIETGGSVIVVEHNLDVIAGADYIIDLGPEAGNKGGSIVVEGPPASIAACKTSLTGQYLKKYLNMKHV